MQGGINRKEKKKNLESQGNLKIKKKKAKTKQEKLCPSKPNSTSICIRLGCLQRPVRMAALFPKLSVKNSPTPFCYSGPRTTLGKEVYPQEA